MSADTLSKLKISLLAMIMFLVGWHCRAFEESKIIDDEAERRLNSYLFRGIQLGLVTVNDAMLCDLQGSNSPPVITEAPSSR